LTQQATPAQIRDETFRNLQAGMTAKRREVLDAFRTFGPGTTWQVAQRRGISILTLRPRATDLLQMGLLELVGRNEEGGIYQAVEMDEAVRRAVALRLRTGEQLCLI
jgi:hypothetical protein